MREGISTGSESRPRVGSSFCSEPGVSVATLSGAAGTTTTDHEKLRSVLLLVSPFALLGCEATGIDRASATAETILEIEAGLGTASEAMDAVCTTLTELTAGEGDMKKQYDAYADAVADMDDQAGRLRDLREQMQEQRDEFQRGWDEKLATIQSAELQERARESAGAGRGEVRSALIAESRRPAAGQVQRVDDPRDRHQDLPRERPQPERCRVGAGHRQTTSARVRPTASRSSVASLREKLKKLADAIQATVPPPLGAVRRRRTELTPRAGGGWDGPALFRPGLAARR